MTPDRSESYPFKRFFNFTFYGLGNVTGTLAFGMDQKQQRRKNDRIQFGKGFAMKIIAIDGSWFRACNILDVSEEGALLQFQKSLSGLVLDEFFLMLSSTGVAFRRCKMAWINGDQMGVHFIKSNERAPAKSSGRPG